MKNPIWFSLAALVLVTGCNDQSSNSSQTSNTSTSTSPGANTNTAGSVVTAPVDYLGALGRAQQNAVKTVDTSALNRAIQLYQVDNGKYPDTLDELVPKYVGRMPTPPYGTKLDYDPNTGEVKVVQAPQPQQ